MTHIEAMKLAQAWFERNTYGDEAVEEYEAQLEACTIREFDQSINYIKQAIAAKRTTVLPTPKAIA